MYLTTSVTSINSDMLLRIITAVTQYPNGPLGGSSSSRLQSQGIRGTQKTWPTPSSLTNPFPANSAV